MLPILIGGAILSALIRGAIDNKAEDIIKEAERRFNSKKEETEKKQKELEITLIRLSNLKYSILKEDFKRFVSFSERLKKRVKIKENFVDTIVQLSRDIEIETTKIEEFIGKAVLGGIALGPAILIGGIVLSSKGEEALTEAKNYEYEVEKAIGKMEAQIRKANCLIKKANEQEKALNNLRNTFNELMDLYEMVDEIAEENLLIIYRLAKSMKDIIDTPLIEKEKEVIC